MSDTASFLRETGEIEVPIPSLERPILPELQSRGCWIKEIVFDYSPRRAGTLVLATVLRPGETVITGAELRNRLETTLKSYIYLGYQHCEWVFESLRRHELREFGSLLGKVHIYFMGSRMVLLDGVHFYKQLYATKHDRRWYQESRSWDIDFASDGRIAIIK